MRTIGVIGLGYVGLPTAIGFHDAGFTVWGVDVSQRTVDMVLQGKTRLATPMLMTLFHSRELKGGISRLQQRKQYHIVMCLVTVPTPITHDLKPDLILCCRGRKSCF